MNDDRTGKRPKVLLVQTRGRNSLTRSERLARQQRGEEVRSMLLEQTLACDVLEEEELLATPGLRGAMYRKLPLFVAQALEARWRASSYDVVMTWSERHSVAVAALFAMTHAKTAHLALMFWISKPTVRLPLRVFRSGIDRIVTWSSVQRDVAIDRIGFRPDDVVLVRHPVDLKFFHPIDRDRQILFSAGSTMRDFETLIKAVEGLEIPVRIAASLVVVLRGFKVNAVDVAKDLQRPTNVEVESLEPIAVRESYARAKVVVVPLLPSDIDAGVNVALEAMAMGRPVIITHTAGQVDVIRDGINGCFVTPQDAQALRAKIDLILENPHSFEEMGVRAREYVEQRHSLEEFVEKIQAQVQDLTDSPPSSRRRSFRWVRRNEPGPTDASLS